MVGLKQLLEHDDVIIGLNGDPTENKNLNLTDYGIYCKNDGTVDLVENGAITQVGVTTYTRGDIFRVARTGTTVGFYKLVGVTPVQIGSLAATPSVGTLYGWLVWGGTGDGVKDAQINWTQPAYTMRAGDAISQTGAYDPYFFIVDTEIPASVKINISGSPSALETVTQVPDDSWWDNMPAPGPGQVVVNQRTGHLTFNAADVGKTVTGELTVVYTRTV